MRKRGRPFVVECFFFLLASLRLNIVVRRTHTYVQRICATQSYRALRTIFHSIERPQPILALAQVNDTIWSSSQDQLVAWNTSGDRVGSVHVESIDNRVSSVVAMCVTGPNVWCAVDSAILVYGATTYNRALQQQLQAADAATATTTTTALVAVASATKRAASSSSSTHATTTTTTTAKPIPEGVTFEMEKAVIGHNARVLSLVHVPQHALVWSGT